MWDGNSDDDDANESGHLLWAPTMYNLLDISSKPQSFKVVTTTRAYREATEPQRDQKVVIGSIWTQLSLATAPTSGPARGLQMAWVWARKRIRFGKGISEPVSGGRGTSA